MNKELYELYIEGLAKGWIDPKNAEITHEKDTLDFEEKLFAIEPHNWGDEETFVSEEFQQALQVYNSKLQKVLE